MGGVLSRPSPLHSCNDRAHHHSHGKKLIYLFILGLAWAFVSQCFGVALLYGSLFAFMCPSVLGVIFFFMAPSLHPLLVQDAIAPITLAFTFQVAFRSMSRVFTLMLTSSPRLARLFCFCNCIFLLCYTFVLSPLLLGVGFKLSFISFWVVCNLFHMPSFESQEPLNHLRQGQTTFSFTLYLNYSRFDHQYKNGVQFISLNRYGTLKVK